MNELILIKDTTVYLHNEKKSKIRNIENTYYKRHGYNEKREKKRRLSLFFFIFVIEHEMMIIYELNYVSFDDHHHLKFHLF